MARSRLIQANRRVSESPATDVSTEFRCVDLFSGAGGFSLGAVNAGARVVAAIELDKHAAATYRRNIANRHGVALYEDDICALNLAEFIEEHFPRGQECDLVLGGPPCQGFSVHRIKGAGVADPRNALILRYFEFVEALRPKAFLMENVPGITWPRHKDFLARFYSSARRAGYSVMDPVTIDARDHGVPQRRKRVFILGVRSDLVFKGAWPPPVTHAEQCSGGGALSGLKPWVPAASVFRRSLRDKDPNAVHMQHSPELVKVFKSTPINGGSRHQSNRVLPCHEEHSGHNDVYGRIDPSQPGPTMTTACVNPSKGRFVHPTEHHGITVRHAARFQTFPDGFVFTGGLMAAGQQVGNAVPVTLAKVLIAHLRHAL